MDFSSEEKQRAVWKGSSPAGCLHIDAEEYCHLHCWINHSRHCCFMAGATSQKEAWQHHRRGLQNDTALIVEEGGEGKRRAAGGFRRQEGMNFDSATVTHGPRLHISLLYTAVGAAGLSLGEVKSNRKQWEDHRTSSKLDVICVTLWMQTFVWCASTSTSCLSQYLLWMVQNFKVQFLAAFLILCVFDTNYSYDNKCFDFTFGNNLQTIK